jgi:hypothetical protein
MITNPDSGTFVLNMVYMSDAGAPTVRTTTTIAANAAASTVKSALDYWYWR